MVKEDLLRVQFFEERLPSTPLPPEPVLTRWGTWLDASMYYASHYEDFKAVVSLFSDTDSKSIQDCKNILNQPELHNSLAFLKSHYSSLSETIKKLEKQQVPLTESIQIVRDLKNIIYAVPGAVGAEVKAKFDAVLGKN